MISALCIKAIIGLGNPGPSYALTRHNIGFRVIDELAYRRSVPLIKKDSMEIGTLKAPDRTILLIKPLTFMNDSGKVIPYLVKQGIQDQNVVVVHDELEKPFGSIVERIGGSARGHNGLKSIIEAFGPEFARLRIGIGRPEDKAKVPDYVLQKFNEPSEEVEAMIKKAADFLENVCSKPCSL